MNVSIGLNSIVVKNLKLDAVDMDGEMVMMNLDKGRYYGLNAVGSRIWELVDKPRLVKDLVLSLLSEYDVDEITCEKDVLTFLEKMYKKELICLN